MAPWATQKMYVRITGSSVYPQSDDEEDEDMKQEEAKNLALSPRIA